MCNTASRRLYLRNGRTWKVPYPSVTVGQLRCGSLSLFCFPCGAACQSQIDSDSVSLSKPADLCGVVKLLTLFQVWWVPWQLVYTWMESLRVMEQFSARQCSGALVVQAETVLVRALRSVYWSSYEDRVLEC